MGHYRCYFWVDSERIAKVEEREWPDDASAARWGEHLIQNPRYHQIEIWNRDRLIDRWHSGRRSR